MIKTLFKMFTKIEKVQLKGNNAKSKIMIKTLLKMFTKIEKVQLK